MYKFPLRRGRLLMWKDRTNVLDRVISYTDVHMLPGEKHTQYNFYKTIPARGWFNTFLRTVAFTHESKLGYNVVMVFGVGVPEGHHIEIDFPQ